MKIMCWYILIGCMLLCYTSPPLYGQRPEELWEMAQEANQHLRTMKLEYQASLEKGPQFNQLPNPELGVGAFILPVETRLGPQRGRLSVTQMFPWFGSQKAKEELANTEAQGKKEMITMEELEVRYDLAISYFRLYEAYASQKIIRRNIELIVSLKSLVESKVSSGKANLADVIRLDILIEKMEKDVRVLENSKRKPTTDINQILQRDLLTPVSVEDSLSFAIQLINKDSLLTNIQKGHPLLNVYRLQQKASNQAKAINQLEGKPSFGLGVDYFNTDQRTDAFPANNGRDAFQFRANVSIPLYRKKYQAKTKEEDYRTQAIEARKIETLSMFEADLEKMYVAYEEARLELSSYEQQVQLTQAAIEVLLAAYSGQSTGFAELLEMEGALLAYELGMLRSVVKSHMANAGLQRYVSF